MDERSRCPGRVLRGELRGKCTGIRGGTREKVALFDHQGKQKTQRRDSNGCSGKGGYASINAGVKSLRGEAANPTEVFGKRGKLQNSDCKKSV